MIVKNPTDNEIFVRIKGVDYSLEPQGEVSVSPEVALHWKNRIHEFIILIDEESDAPAAVEVEEEVVVEEEAPAADEAPVVEEEVAPAEEVAVVEEAPVVEEPVAEAPKKKGGKK